MYLIPIPHTYIWMTEGSSDRAALFKRYVKGYVRNNYPELELVKIVGMKAICRKRDSG